MVIVKMIYRIQQGMEKTTLRRSLISHSSFLSLLISALLISACSNDPEETKEPENALGMVSFTRGDNSFTAMEDYSPVGVFMVDDDGTTPTQSGRFVYKSNETPAIWRSSIDSKSKQNMTMNVSTMTGQNPAFRRQATHNGITSHHSIAANPTIPMARAVSVYWL